MLQLIENSESVDKDYNFSVNSGGWLQFMFQECVCIRQYNTEISVPRGSAMMGEGLLHQVYKCICQSMKQGYSIKEISRILGTEYSTTRFAIKYLMLYNLLDVTVLDYKRQRTSK